MEVLAWLVFFATAAISLAAILFGLDWLFGTLISRARAGDAQARLMLGLFAGIAVYGGFFWSIDYLWGPL